MLITPTNSIVSSLTPPPITRENQMTFRSVLNMATSTNARSEVSPDKPVTDARAAATQLVAITFVEPILKVAREARSTEPPFGQTPAERQFGSLLDAQTAQRIVSSWNLSIVDRIARDIAARTAQVQMQDQRA